MPASGPALAPPSAWRAPAPGMGVMPPAPQGAKSGARSLAQVLPTLAHGARGPGWGWWASRRERAAPLRAAWGDCDGAPPALQASAPRSLGPVSVLLSNVRFFCCFSVCSSRLSGLLSAALSPALRRHQDAQSWPKRVLGVASASVGKAVPL